LGWPFTGVQSFIETADFPFFPLLLLLLAIAEHNLWLVELGPIRIAGHEMSWLLSYRLRGNYPQKIISLTKA